jgi:hypothetical protein
MTHNDLRYESGPYQLNPSKHLLAAFGVAERCGDHEGAGLALLIMFEEINDGLDRNERIKSQTS